MTPVMSGAAAGRHPVIRGHVAAVPGPPSRREASTSTRSLVLRLRAGRCRRGGRRSAASCAAHRSRTVSGRPARSLVRLSGLTQEEAGAGPRDTGCSQRIRRAATPVIVPTRTNGPVRTGDANRLTRPTAARASLRPVSSESASSDPFAASSVHTALPPTTGEPCTDAGACHRLRRLRLPTSSRSTPLVHGTNAAWRAGAGGGRPHPAPPPPPGRRPPPPPPPPPARRERRPPAPR